MANPAGISGERMMEDLGAIVRWTRLAGSAEELEAARYVESRLRAAGAAAQIVLHDAYVSLPGPARLSVAGPGGGDIPCITHSMGVSTPPGGMTAELVYAGGGDPAALTAAGAAGRCVLIGAGVTPERALAATRAGAAGAIFTSGRVVQEMCCSPVWGSPGESNRTGLPGVPLFSLARADGEALRARCEGKRLTVHGTAEVRSGWTKTPIVLGDLAPGHPAADPAAYVLFSGHLDSWYGGAMDNGSANAVMLELTRAFARRRADLRRGLRVAFWSGHSHGRYSGSAWYADNRWFDLEANCVMHINIDVVGAVGGDLLVTTAMREAEELARRAMLEGSGAAGPIKVDRMRRTSDESFWGVGVPSMFGEVSRQPDGTFGWWIHTPDDTIDKLDPVRLVRDARIYYHALDRLLTDPVLPLDYAATAADIGGALGEIAERSGGRFDLSSAQAAAAELTRLCARLNEARGAAAGGAAGALNACLRDLGRILIPATYHRSGRFTQDPALPSTFLPGLAPAARLAALELDSDEARFLATDLVRARNELAFALRRACGRVESFLADHQ
jgi:hypothetical protein